MPKKALKAVDKKQWAYRPSPTQTPHEIMLRLDAENMVRLLHELIASMPHTFKAALKGRGFLEFKVADYDILITSKEKFERNGSTYGKAVG